MRLFVAIDVSERLRERIASELAALRIEAPRAKWVAPEGYHLTLVFLGSVAERELDRVCAAVDAAAARHPPLTLDARGLGVFGRRRPTVLWLGFDGDLEPLRALQADLQRELAALGFEQEDRPYSPHLTLARSRSAGGDPALARCADAPAPALGRLEVRSVTLYDSTTHADGPRYTARYRAPLRGEPPR